MDLSIIRISVPTMPFSIPIDRIFNPGQSSFQSERDELTVLSRRSTAACSSHRPHLSGARSLTLSLASLLRRMIRLDDLPDEVLAQLLEELHLPEMTRLRQTCKAWKGEDILSGLAFLRREGSPFNKLHLTYMTSWPTPFPDVQCQGQLSEQQCLRITNDAVIRILQTYQPRTVVMSALQVATGRSPRLPVGGERSVEPQGCPHRRMPGDAGAPACRRAPSWHGVVVRVCCEPD